MDTSLLLLYGLSLVLAAYAALVALKGLWLAAQWVIDKAR